MDTRGPISEAGQIDAKAAAGALPCPGGGPIPLQRQTVTDEIDHVLHRIRIDITQSDDYVALAGQHDECRVGAGRPTLVAVPALLDIVGAAAFSQMQQLKTKRLLQVYSINLHG